MNLRNDVRRMLLKRGWVESNGIARKDGAAWTPANFQGDSGVDAAGKAYSISFTVDVPARVITAIAETVAADKPRSRES